MTVSEAASAANTLFTCSAAGWRRRRPTLQYGGYWFEYTDAWPDDWGYDDDFYIDYIDDDYYLYNRRHPGMRILVIVVE